MTLEQILKKETEKRHEEGIYGINACKESINRAVELFGADYYTQLKQYVERANEDVFFNRAMVLACWELINGR